MKGLRSSEKSRESKRKRENRQSYSRHYRSRIPEPGLIRGQKIHHQHPRGQRAGGRRPVRLVATVGQ